MSEKCIVMVLPRGETIRNFVLSGMADLIRKEAKLHLISIIPNEDFRKILLDHCDSLHELEPADEPRVIWTLRDWQEMVHGRYVWSGAAQLRWKIRDHEAKESFPLKVSRVIKKTFAIPFANNTGLSLVDKLECTMSEKWWPNKKYNDLLKKLKPTLVFNGSHIHAKLAWPVMHAARKLGVHTTTFLFSWDNLTSQGRIIPPYSTYLTWNQGIQNDLLHYYPNIKHENTEVVGTPQFDFHFDTKTEWTREFYCQRLGLDPNRPILLYTTGMLNLMPKEEFLVLRIADYLNTLPSRPQLVVRIYPKDLSGRYDQIKKERTDIIFPDIPWEPNHLTPMPDDLALWSNMLRHADVGLNVASTVALELAMFDKPIINIAYNPPGHDIYPRDFALYYSWEHYKPITDSGAVYLAWSEEQCFQQIQEAMDSPAIHRTERKRLVNAFFGTYLDGKSYQRIAQHLLKHA